MAVGAQCYEEMCEVEQSYTDDASGQGLGHRARSGGGRQAFQVEGSLAELDASDVRRAASRVKSGKVYSLDSQWWNGMPVAPAHPPFQVLTYRTPRGQRNQGDIEWLGSEGNSGGFGFISDMVMGTTHTGTHIDALCHVTGGERSEWYGGHGTDLELGDFGPLTLHAGHLPAVITRGVLLDIPALGKREVCEPECRIGARVLGVAAEAIGVEIGPGDAVLVRTGQMRHWPDVSGMSLASGAGVTLDGAEWLVERGVAIVGSDTPTFEARPSGIVGRPQPVHEFLIREHGVPIMEWVYLEELAADDVWQFAFICLPLRVQGATGSLVRPVAII